MSEPGNGKQDLWRGW